jgi:prevent-host-death family protein
MCMSYVSSRDLRNHTAEVLRRVEQGERISITVNRRPVAQLSPFERPEWMSSAAVGRIIMTGSADQELLDDLAPLREQTIEPE